MPLLIDEDKSVSLEDVATETQIVSQTNEQDAVARYDVECEDNKIPQSGTNRLESAEASLSSRKVVSWEDGDPENPYNWSRTKKMTIVGIGMIIVVNGTLGTGLPANAIPFISKEFNIASPAAQILPLSVYLLGFVFGPLLFGPLSETYGRRIILVSTFLFFTIFTMACAVASNFASLLIFRFLAGVNASCPISVVGGVYADIYENPATRGRAMALFMLTTCVGPAAAPAISGFVSTSIGWRWSFWIGLILAGATLIPLLVLPETFGPVLLERRAKALRKSTGNSQIFAPIDQEKKELKHILTVTLTRPLRMICFEPIVTATSVYLAFVYGIFFMCFEAYPIVYQGIYRMSPGVAGLMFLPFLGGALLATGMFMQYDTFWRTAQIQKKSWTQREEARRLPLACIGGPFVVISLFWFGWTSREGISFVVPMLSGFPFGIGFVLLFIALINYLADAYRIYAASALAAASCLRSLMAAVLPFATDPLYGNLGVAWASSLLAFLSLGMCAISFLFLWQGHRLRAASKFCTSYEGTNPERRQG